MCLTLQKISTIINNTTIVEATPPKKTPIINATEVLDSSSAISASGNPKTQFITYHGYIHEARTSLVYFCVFRLK